MSAAPAMPMAMDAATHPRDVVDPAACAQTIRVVETVVRDVPEALLRPWQRLVAESAEANAFAEPWFVGAGLRNLPADHAVRLVQVWRGEDLLGLIPLHVDRHYGRIRVRNVQNWQHFHDFLGTPAVRRGAERRFWIAIITHLDRSDWACGFLHIAGLVEGGAVAAGLKAAAHALGRAAPIVHRSVRAELASDLTPEAYYESRVRKKKRKEIGRLSRRLSELGAVTTASLTPGEDTGPWCDSFLALERSGWKGRAGSALSCDVHTETFFREVVAGAAAAGRLDILRMDLDGKPIAMLVNFITPPGSFSFKIAFDESYARFSPGVLIQLENLRLLARDDVAWMDSCAIENHPMIDSLWRERRTLVRATIRLLGVRRGLVYYGCRLLEKVSAGRWTAFKALVMLFGLEELV